LLKSKYQYSIPYQLYCLITPFDKGDKGVVMKKLLISSLSALCIQALPLTLHADEINIEEKQALVKGAKTQIMALGGALTATLKQGIKTNGHAASVQLCNLQAPAITKSVSSEGGFTDWTISRTSLKLRSPANAPEGWVEQVMKDFEQRKANGEMAKDIAHTEVRDGKFYLVKAIPTKAGCLACHGSNVAPDVKARLTELYPNDKGTGFNVGDIRGVFIASKALDSTIDDSKGGK
tara:strand:- start:1394 stop:2098 length:705 start_codon:yes stop_codon:yes gene_type:complete